MAIKTAQDFLAAVAGGNGTGEGASIFVRGLCMQVPHDWRLVVEPSRATTSKGEALMQLSLYDDNDALQCSVTNSSSEELEKRKNTFTKFQQAGTLMVGAAIWNLKSNKYSIKFGTLLSRMGRMIEDTAIDNVIEMQLELLQTDGPNGKKRYRVSREEAVAALQAAKSQAPKTQRKKAA